MAIQIDKAVEFVTSHGNEVDQARLKFILLNEPASLELLAKLFDDQRPDGGFQPFWTLDYSSLDATCYRLTQAEQLGINGAESAVQRALHFLAERQSLQGCWEEDAMVTQIAPPWAKPGDLSAKLYMTANCGLWLALLGDSNDRASKAASLLQTHLDTDGGLPGFLNTHWLAGGLWHKLGQYGPATQVCGYLHREINRLAASDLAWMITTLCAAGVISNHPLIKEAAAFLQGLQHADGHWQSADGRAYDVHTTLESLRALKYCAIPDPSARGVQLRRVIESDLPIFFEHQLDPLANHMATFPAREWKVFMDHWDRIMADEAVILRTILYNGQVAGNIVSWQASGEREVGYWIGREYWGKGIATQALRKFLEVVPARPLHAHVAKHNLGSIRVLEKCGFITSGEDSFTDEDGKLVEETLMTLTSDVEG